MSFWAPSFLRFLRSTYLKINLTPHPYKITDKIVTFDRGIKQEYRGL
jgi:hypothetical protein